VSLERALDAHPLDITCLAMRSTTASAARGSSCSMKSRIRARSSIASGMGNSDDGTSSTSPVFSRMLASTVSTRPSNVRIRSARPLDNERIVLQSDSVVGLTQRSPVPADCGARVGVGVEDVSLRGLRRHGRSA
jgi:hypothetical protein